jgi:flagellar basal body-associated protein FliL
MKQLFENKKLMIGIAIGLVLIIGTVVFFVLRKSSSGSTATASNTNSSTTVTKEVADTSGGTISANSAASKGTLFV